MDQEQKMPSKDAISGAMEAILAHPELISMVASALGGSAPNVAPNVAQKPNSEEQTDTAPVPSEAPVFAANESTPKTTDVMARLSPLLTELSKGKLGGRADDKRACLLRALKPYVSQGRREAIDYMIGLSHVTDLLKQLS